MANYKFLNSAGDWRKGDVVTDSDIAASNLGGVGRLLDLKAVEATDDKPMIKDRDGARSPNETKGDNVEVGSGDTVDNRAARRAEAVGDVNNGKRTLGERPTSEAAEPGAGDAAALTSPPTGRPGTVIKTAGAPSKK